MRKKVVIVSIVLTIVLIILLMLIGGPFYLHYSLHGYKVKEIDGENEDDIYVVNGINYYPSYEYIIRFSDEDVEGDFRKIYVHAVYFSEYIRLYSLKESDDVLVLQAAGYGKELYLKEGRSLRNMNILHYQYILDDEILGDYCINDGAKINYFINGDNSVFKLSDLHEDIDYYEDINRAKIDYKGKIKIFYECGITIYLPIIKYKEKYYLWVYYNYDKMDLAFYEIPFDYLI